MQKVSAAAGNADVRVPSSHGLFTPLLGGGEGKSFDLWAQLKSEDIRASTVSLMPEGLEEKMSKKDLADVIAYLRGGL